MNQSVQLLLGGSPTTGTWQERLAKAGWRSLRTLLQGLVGAFPAAGPASAIVDATYWATWRAGAVIAITGAFVSLLQNLIAIVPDPGQD